MVNVDNKLPIAEEFYSLQGEGFHVGKAAYFVRLAGCDVGCHWCDSKPAWNMFPHQWTDVDEVIERIIKNPSNVVVITGGEPFSHNLNYFTNKLKYNHIQTHVETSGTEPITGIWDWISFSPKPWHRPLDEFFIYSNELKIIIQNLEDFEWAEYCKQKVHKECMLFLQPEWSSFNKILPGIVEYIKNHPEWRISIQAHKFMKIL
ncbi:MAG: 7-carboxy-7-deazaguanine synthase QueE [Bacteroidales bacterium]|nr:7-carboxy-7-deazaguanine synthase QueE [Bacteroidales bacterium]